MLPASHSILYISISMSISNDIGTMTVQTPKTVTIEDTGVRYYGDMTPYSLVETVGHFGLRSVNLYAYQATRLLIFLTQESPHIKHTNGYVPGKYTAVGQSCSETESAEC
jgi:hypothetical protein